MRQSLEATITRADGRVEHLGEIGYWHEKWTYRVAHRLRRKAWLFGKRVTVLAGLGRALLLGA